MVPVFVCSGWPSPRGVAGVTGLPVHRSPNVSLVVGGRRRRSRGARARLSTPGPGDCTHGLLRRIDRAWTAGSTAHPRYGFRR
jgi:hypothetical protein